MSSIGSYDGEYQECDGIAHKDYPIQESKSHDCGKFVTNSIHILVAISAPSGEGSGVSISSSTTCCEPQDPKDTKPRQLNDHHRSKSTPAQEINTEHHRH